MVCTGNLANIEAKEVAQHFYQHYCGGSHAAHNDDTYLKTLLQNIFSLCGYKNFVRYFRNEATSTNISLSKVIKKIQKTFSEEEWQYLKKYHKRSRTNSKLSSTLSHASVGEEEKYSHTSHSETGSIASGRRSANSD